MKLIECSQCGGRELLKENGYIICSYCKLQFIPNSDDDSISKSAISVYTDVQKLLERCKIEPENRNRLVNLILDIDPTNAEVKQYIR